MGSAGDILLRMRGNTHFSSSDLKSDITNVFGDPNHTVAH